MSTYRYLAPCNKGVLRFSASDIPLFPNSNEAYVRPTAWGTVIKLYEYKLQGKSHILRRDGLLRRLDILLPGTALPIRLHECRRYGGGSASFDNSLTGLRVRLSDDRNLETGFPTSGSIVIQDQEMYLEIYAFQRGKADTYIRPAEGLVFTVNGQTQGKLRRSFFGRNSVGLSRLKDSLLVMVDCSFVDVRHREDLFINDRDGMAEGPFLKAIERELEQVLKNHQGLRDLREHRKREDASSKLEDSKPFKEMLSSILRKSPVLASLFGTGGPLPNPSNHRPKPDKDFVGKPHPSVFRFRNKNYGDQITRNTAVNRKSSRMFFETDVVNDYFNRGQFRGKYILGQRNGYTGNGTPPNYNLNLWNGVATLNLKLPQNAKVGATYEYEFLVDDETLLEPFVNRFDVSITSSQKQPTPPQPPGLAVPNTVPVYKSNWTNHDFDEFSALKAHYDPPDDGSPGSHTYYINMDNYYLQSELRSTKANVDILKARWQYAMALIAMALLRDDKAPGSSNGNAYKTEGHGEELSPEDKAFEATKAIAPILLPMLQHLGGLSDEDIR